MWIGCLGEGVSEWPSLRRELPLGVINNDYENLFVMESGCNRFQGPS